MTSLADGSPAAGGQAAGGAATFERIVPAPALSDGAPSVDGAAIRDGNPDLLLLRTYEPVLRYTAGELFLPTRWSRTWRGAACGRTTAAAGAGAGSSSWCRPGS